VWTQGPEVDSGRYKVAGTLAWHEWRQMLSSARLVFRCPVSFVFTKLRTDAPPGRRADGAAFLSLVSGSPDRRVQVHGDIGKVQTPPSCSFLRSRCSICATEPGVSTSWCAADPFDWRTHTSLAFPVRPNFSRVNHKPLMNFETLPLSMPKDSAVATTPC
jgi:hypothetical protein